MLNGWGREAGNVAGRAGLRRCGIVTDVGETVSVEFPSMGNTAPGKLKAEAAVVKDVVVLTGAAVTENASGKSEDVKNAGAEDEDVPKRSKF